MNRRELDELLQPRELPDQNRMLRDVFAHASADPARGQSPGSAETTDSGTDLGFSDSAFRPIRRASSRRWLTAAVAAATAIVVGGLGWSVAIQSPLAVQPGGQPVPTVPPTLSPTPTPTATPTPAQTPSPQSTPTPATQLPSVRPPSVNVVEQRPAGQVLLVTYRICSGSGAATVTGPVGNRDTSVVLPAGMPPRMNAFETVGPDQCILRGEAFSRPSGPVSGRLDVRFTFQDSAPEKQFNAYYGDAYDG